MAVILERKRGSDPEVGVSSAFLELSGESKLKGI
jgi:hypothetical protein